MKKKILSSVIVAIIIAMIIPINAFAKSEEIRSIDITVQLDSSGNAYVTEVWDATADSDNTEWYLVKDNLNGSVISDFSVTDETGKKFVNEGDWNIDRSISQKAGKCGIVDKGDGSYELCWGAGDHNNHVFTVTYTMSNMVMKYTDGYNGFNQRFINAGLSSTPENIKITILSNDYKFSAENSGIWAFGFEGTVNFTDEGTIVATTSSRSDHYFGYANIMVRFDGSMFTPTNISNKSFDSVRKTAFEGSDYSEDVYNGNGGDNTYTEKSSDKDIGEVFGAMIPIFIVICGFIIKAVSKNSSGRSVIGSPISYGIDRKAIKELPYSRNVPLQGDLIASFAVLRDLKVIKSDGALICAYLLRWMQNGRIVVKETPAKKFLGLLGEEMQSSVEFVTDGADLTGVERSLWQLLLEAAGGDQILQEKELYKWSKSNYKDLNDWFDTAYEIGVDRLTELGSFDTVEKKMLFITYNERQVTPKGREIAVNLLGFKKYLEDFTIINERKAVEVNLWNDYLVFASLYGIADKVAEDFKDICPEYFETPAYGYGDYDTFDMLITLHMLNAISTAGANGAREGYSAAQAAQSSGGGGGFSSFGGGGGFSGGGFGGGGR